MVVAGIPERCLHRLQTVAEIPTVENVLYEVLPMLEDIALFTFIQNVLIKEQYRRVITPIK